MTNLLASFLKDWKTTGFSGLAAFAAYVWQDPTIIHAIPEPYQFWVYKLFGFLFYIGLIGMGASARDKGTRPSASETRLPDQPTAPPPTKAQPITPP
jgi:hypothetical protein